eukprot:Blabericola_migrator_1__8769@NODE_461_length_8293_cov_107_238877_g360_i0_p9_GENE_NODE_461_length_8293_cov_107_238877_g360_i0NODE_461_length_8293_cov_107_238877_g360_i0_p9_ORF_typecomplete_len125_score13_82Glt_symporter/PF03616_14/0_49_NODE_461_length_8293_cov_107_238877_g360_i09031277
MLCGASTMCGTCVIQAFGALALASFLCLIGLVVQFRDNTKALRFVVVSHRLVVKFLRKYIIPQGSTCGALFLVAGSLIQYFIIARISFQMANSQGHYPTPQPHLCWYMTLGECFTNAGCQNKLT